MLGLFACLCVAVSGCRETKTTTAVVVPGVADSADQVLMGVTTVMVTRGVERGKLLADTAYVLDDQTRYDLRHAHVNFTTETGAPQGTMQADRGMYNLRSQTLEGWGHVVIKLVDGRTLTSPHVTYNQATHIITSDTTFEMSDAQGAHGTGIGFRSNESFTSFSCLRNCGGSSSVLLPKK